MSQTWPSAAESASHDLQFLCAPVPGKAMNGYAEEPKKTPQKSRTRAGCSLGELQKKHNSQRQVLDVHLRGFQLGWHERVFPGPWRSRLV